MILKKMILFFYCIGVAIVLIQCDRPTSKYKKGENLLNKQLKISIKKIRKKYNLNLDGIGGGTDENGIWLVTLMFARYAEPWNKETGRRVIIDCVENLLNDINNNVDLKPFLKFYPFKPNNISLTIIQYKENGDDYVHPEISVFAEYGNEITFKSNNPQNLYKFLLDIYEPYDNSILIEFK